MPCTINEPASDRTMHSCGSAMPKKLCSNNVFNMVIIITITDKLL